MGRGPGRKGRPPTAKELAARRDRDRERKRRYRASLPSKPKKPRSKPVPPNTTGTTFTKPLPPGEVRFVEVLKAAVKRVGDDDPVVEEMLAVQLRIARGDRAFRYCGEQLRAASAVLDRVAGRPREAERRGESLSDVDRWLESLKKPKDGE